MKNLAAVPQTCKNPKLGQIKQISAETITVPVEPKTLSRQVTAGRVTLNIISSFGNEKLSDILYQVAGEKIEENSIGTASRPWYNKPQTEVKIARPTPFSQFGGKL